MQRKLAFCVGSWSAESTLFSWTYAKRYFLRKVQDEQGNEVLSELDTLFIVHVNSGKSRDRWDAGGPIMPRLSSALANYPHRVVELEGRDTAAAILEFVAKEDIDILILGSREHKGAMTKMGVGTLGSTSESVKSRCKCPCLIIRPSSARHEHMRIRSMSNMAALRDGGIGGQASRGSLLRSPAEPEPRKVCIAFERAEPGSHMTAWAAKHCLFPDDDIHLVHITNRSPLEKMQKSASFQKAMLKPRASTESAAAADEDCDSVGTEELAGYLPPRRTRLKGDAKSELCVYLETHRIDLLIVGFSAAGRFRKALAGGSLSTYMLHHAACPLVVLPLKSMAWEDQDTLSSLPELALGSMGAAAATEAVPLSDGDGTSPPPLNSLGPRVSISRSLSHQLALMRDQRRRSVDAAGTSTSPPTAASTVPDATRSHSDTGISLPSSSTAELAPGGRPSSSSFVSPHADEPLPIIQSPFQVSSFSRDSAESMDSQGHAVRKSFSSGTQPQDSLREIAWLRQQLEERDSRVISLQAEVDHLKLQLAKSQGSLQGSLPLSQASSRAV